MSLSVVIPCFNEEHRLPATIMALKAYFRNFEAPVELIVADDGSTDGSIAVIRSFAETERSNVSLAVKVVASERHRGKGAAIRSGILAANHDYLLLCDADLSVPIEEVEKLWRCRSRAPLVIGSRSRPLAKQIGMEAIGRKIAGAFFASLARRSLRLPQVDLNCGFKLLRRDEAQRIVQRLTIDGWGYDAEILKIAVMHHVPVLEVPVAWEHKQGSKVRIARDVLSAVTDILQILRNVKGGRYA